MDQPAFMDYENEQIRWRLIEIFNTGVPIPAKNQNALFGKLQVTGRIEHHKQGSGLSLPIARSAVENHGGKLFLVSDAANGNSFYMLLPFLDAVPVLPAIRGSNSWNEIDECFGGTASDKKVCKVANPTSLKVELEHVGSSTFCDLN